MAKTKTTFFCSNCGQESPKWAGKCPSCGEWNTFTEEVVVKTRETGASVFSPKKGSAVPVRIADIKSDQLPRLIIPDTEFNQVLGGGLVPGSVTLIGGEPGIGKSTLMLQIALNTPVRSLYISGEESEEQIKLRADRIPHADSECAIVTETRLESVLNTLNQYQPGMVIIDSIQTMHSELLDATAGECCTRECAGQLLRFAKENDVPVLLIGHITKDGSIAGPKLLEHMVDTVVQFEGDRHHSYRIIRPLKNRFGNTGEMGIYSMTGTGLEAVKNPSEVLLAQRDEALSGVATGCALEGMRPILLEVQSLVSSAVYGTPQRSSTGFDLRRLNMLLAVLEKRCGFRLGSQDVFVNIAGGLRMEDPALDLSIAAAVMSSYLSVAISSKTVFAAEVGLSGEIRAVQRIDQRITEAAKLGFEEIIISKYNQKFAGNKGIRVKTYGRIDEVFRDIFGQVE